MRYAWFAVTLVTLLTLALAIPAQAQDKPGPPPDTVAPPSPKPAGPPPPRSTEREHDKFGSVEEEDIRELVTTVMMVRVSRALELTDEQTVVMVRHVQDLRESMSQLYKDRERLSNELRELTDASAPDDQISGKLAELMALEDKRVQLRRDAYEKGGASLNTKQKAKLYLTLQDFESQVRRLVMRAKEMSPERLMKFREEFEKAGSDRDYRGPSGEFMKQMKRERHRDGSPDKDTGKEGKAQKPEPPQKEAPPAR